MAIRGNTDLRRRLRDEVLFVSDPTFQRYLNENHERLTLPGCLRAIREELGITDSEILEEEKEMIEQQIKTRTNA